MTGTDRPDDATTAAYTDRERAIVAALTRLSVRGPDPDERAPRQGPPDAPPRRRVPRDHRGAEQRRCHRFLNVALAGARAGRPFSGPAAPGA